jgi:hypothetical protein
VDEPLWIRYVHGRRWASSEAIAERHAEAPPHWGRHTDRGLPADTTAPATPLDLAATVVNSSTVGLRWRTPLDNVGIVGYDVYRDDVLLASTGPRPAFTDTTAVPSVTHTYRVAARDGAGNTSALSDAVVVSSAAVVFEDDFESGDLSKWSTVNGLVVQSTEVFAGSYSARATSTGSPAWARRPLGRTEPDLYCAVRFKPMPVLGTATNANLLRFRTASTSAILTAYVTSTGRLGFRNDVGAAPTTSETTVATGVWHTLQIRVNVPGGQTEVWLDGSRIPDLSFSHYLGANPVGVLDLGDSSTGRNYDVAFDNLACSNTSIDVP